MRTCKCEQCGGEFPMNETLCLEGRILCRPCCEQALAGGDNSKRSPERQADPTICVNCEKDNGTTELSLLAGLPVCDACQSFFRNRPFPGWIKMALAGVIVLVVVSLVWNLRFFQAYAGIHRAWALWGQGQSEMAATQMAGALAHVPESQEIRILAAYMEGVSLLGQDRCTEALSKLEQCRGQLPPQFGLEVLIAQAAGGAAFDAGDYDGFLKSAEALDQALGGQHYLGKVSLASAWACKHAQTGDPDSRQKAMGYLEQAKALAQDDPSYAEYEDRILHRLDSREIITRDEFMQRFPNGWRQQKEQ